MSAQDAVYQLPEIPRMATKVLATGYAECGGGMAANASVAVARLGGEAHYWGRLGDDALGTRILDELAGEGVDTSRVRRLPGVISPSAAVVLDAARAAGEPAIFDGDIGPVAALEDLAQRATHAVFSEPAEGQALDQAASFASAAAALKCARFGGRRGTPSRAEVLQFLESNAA